MIYALLYPLCGIEGLSFLNVLRYVSFRIVAAFLTALLLMFAMAPAFIRKLQRGQIGQVIRSDGPESHFSKAGTPTMGGALMLLNLVLATVLWAKPANAMLWLVLLVTVAYGVIGYIDDAAKVRGKSAAGLSARGKLIGQFGIVLPVVYVLFIGDDVLSPDWMRVRWRVALPFVAFEKLVFELPSWLYAAFAAVVVVGTSNAVNLTDGLDGLAIGPVIIAAGTFLVLAYLAGLSLFGRDVAAYLHLPSIASASELAVYAAAMTGVGFGFLWYNTYPAQVFMGDVGSLALGGGLGMLAVCTKNEVLSVILGGIFVVEAASVIAQVTSFKLTGKRVFLMAPIHHHFEKKGWAEPKIIVRFWIIALMLAALSLASVKVR